LNSLVEPGHFGLNQDCIVVIKNFVESEHLKTIQNFLPTINEWVDPGESLYSEDGTCLYSADYWRNRQCSGDIIQKLNNNIYEIIEYYINKMQQVLETQFSVKLSNRPPVLVKWTSGTEQQPHADKQLNDGSPNPFPDYDLNSLIYYNDDFEGGELYYPEHDIVIKPEPGLAVAHPGDIHFLHGVKRIISGERWTTPSFYTVTDLL
jgi:hypothetical protein